MDANPEEELFERLAVAIGESLEQVWSMPDVERRQLIEVLNLVPVEEQGRQGGDEDAGRGKKARKPTDPTKIA